MDYQRHYDLLIGRARTRQINGYVERHHVIPRCLGGGDDQENLVRLTAEEHYVAHQLLVKIYPNDHRLMWALSAMTGKDRNLQRPNNKRYAWLRKRFAKMISERQRGRKMSDEARANMRARTPAMLGRTHSEETKAKQSAAAKGRKKSAAHCKAMSSAKSGKKRGPYSEEHRRSISAGLRERAKTMDYSYLRDPNYRAGQAAKMKLIWAERRRAKQGE